MARVPRYFLGGEAYRKGERLPERELFRRVTGKLWSRVASRRQSCPVGLVLAIPGYRRTAIAQLALFAGTVLAAKPVQN